MPTLETKVARLEDELDELNDLISRIRVPVSTNSGDGPGGAGATTFKALTDTPANFAGQALKTVRVNAAASALEFVDAVGGDRISDVVDQDTYFFADNNVARVHANGQEIFAATNTFVRSSVDHRFNQAIRDFNNSEGTDRQALRSVLDGASRKVQWSNTVEAVTLIADMTVIGEFYELTAPDGPATTGLYYKAQDNVAKQVANF